MYNITFQQIETFLTVAKCLNLSKAAVLLSFTQPAISKMLKKFEESLGMKLFTSSNQGMGLTADGEYLFSVLEPQYRSLDQSIHNARLNSRAPAKVLHIVGPSLYDYLDDYDALKEIVGRYERKYPDVHIRERLCDFGERRQALEYGEADFVFTEDFVVQDIQNISLKPVKPINIYLSISAKHPLAQLEELDFKALSGETFFTIKTVNEQFDIESQEYTCSQLGFTPKKIEILPNYETLVHMVGLGKGVSLSAKLKHIGPDSDIRLYPIKLETTHSVVVAWRNGRLSRQARDFINMLPDAGANLTNAG
jgi:DNA-binding transcriptional LysR family regulator